MHLLTSFIGCSGVLISNSGVEEILKNSFAGMEKIFYEPPYLTANTEVYLVLDRYHKYSIKGLTKVQRAGSIEQQPCSVTQHIYSIKKIYYAINWKQGANHLYHFKVLNRKGYRSKL